MTAVANPYAADIGNLEPRNIIADTAHELIRLEEQLGADGLERSLAPGKWTARMILCHLTDCEIAFGFRLRQALAEPHHVIQPFDQDAWNRRYQDPSMTAHTALQVFAALRGWNVVLLNSLPPGAFAKPVFHPERGEMTLQTIVETMAGHDLHHVRQLQKIASQTAAA
jgi:DinB superfamily